MLVKASMLAAEGSGEVGAALKAQLPGKFSCMKTLGAYKQEIDGTGMRWIRARALTLGCQTWPPARAFRKRGPAKLMVGELGSQELSSQDSMQAEPLLVFLLFVLGTYQSDAGKQTAQTRIDCVAAMPRIPPMA